MPFFTGKSYKGFHDLAVEQFSSLKNEIQIMDDRKKEAIYELGCCFEAMGSPERPSMNTNWFIRRTYPSVAFRKNQRLLRTKFLIGDRRMAERGIRTPGTFGTPDFESGTFDHSATSPRLGYRCQPIHVLANLGIIERKKIGAVSFECLRQNSRSKGFRLLQHDFGD